jgi:hypothetical protein
VRHYFDSIKSETGTSRSFSSLELQFNYTPESLLTPVFGVLCYIYQHHKLRAASRTLHKALRHKSSPLGCVLMIAKVNLCGCVILNGRARFFNSAWINRTSIMNLHLVAINLRNGFICARERHTAGNSLFTLRLHLMHASYLITARGRVSKMFYTRRANLIMRENLCKSERCYEIAFELRIWEGSVSLNAI